MRMRSLVSMGDLAKPVMGMLMSFSENRREAKSLSRDWVMASAEFRQYTPKCLNCRRQGTSVEGDGGLDPRNDGVKLVEDVASAVSDFGRMNVQLHIGMFHVQEHHLMSAGFTGFHDPLVAVKLGVGGEQAYAEPVFLSAKER